MSSIQTQLSKEQKKTVVSQSDIEIKSTNLENVRKQLKEARRLKQATAEVYEKIDGQQMLLVENIKALLK